MKEGIIARRVSSSLYVDWLLKDSESGLVQNTDNGGGR